MHGLLCKRQTVRDIINIHQPTRLASMQEGRLQRRQHFVHGPNQIWHIDGNDKLLPYGFGISGAIDGWSRRLIWLKVGNTNKNPKLICSYFLSAVQELGILPSIVRMDRGTENVTAAYIKTLLRVDQNDDFSGSPVMYGSSNHNSRIERWLGYGRNAIFQYYMDIFKDLEMSGILRKENVLHMECLRFCFMPALRKEMENHFEQWTNFHRVRQIKNLFILSGVPDFLHKYPEYYGATDQGKHVNYNVVQRHITACSCAQSEFGCCYEFAEWALNVLLANGLPITKSMLEAFHLFSKLVLEIYTFENNN